LDLVSIPGKGQRIQPFTKQKMTTRHVTIIITESIEIAHGEFFKAKTFALLNDFIFVASSMAYLMGPKSLF